jgi:hypothetical protein
VAPGHPKITRADDQEWMHRHQLHSPYVLTLLHCCQYISAYIPQPNGLLSSYQQSSMLATSTIPPRGKTVSTTTLDETPGFLIAVNLCLPTKAPCLQPLQLFLEAKQSLRLHSMKLSVSSCVAVSISPRTYLSQMDLRLPTKAPCLQPLQLFLEAKQSL